MTDDEQMMDVMRALVEMSADPEFTELSSALLAFFTSRNPDERDAAMERVHRESGDWLEQYEKTQV